MTPIGNKTSTGTLVAVGLRALGRGTHPHLVRILLDERPNSVPERVFWAFSHAGSEAVDHPWRLVRVDLLGIDG